ncbi:MAG: hypothetical protein OES09_17540 [Gammaproteobacteria bacterium]|nr:hypothetical protein [Gammaproteobacteria bacterium]
MRTHWLHNRRGALILIISLAWPVTGDTDTRPHPYDRALLGLQAFALQTAGFRPEYRRLGIDEARLSERTQARLRDAGLTLVEESEALSDPRGALLRLNLKLVFTTYFDTHYYELTLQVVQNQPLPQNSRAVVPRIIWAQHINGHTSELRLKRVNQIARDLIDRFITAHRQQNSLP